MQTATAHAFARFGLGRRTIDAAAGDAPAGDPAAWLRAQLNAPDPLPPEHKPSSATGLEAIRQDRETKPDPGSSRIRAVYRDAAEAELAHAIATTTPFRERLVWFWANHFTVSLRRGEVAAVAGAFVEEAIRPHVTGRFEDMVLAVMRHPAMLLYLDNAQSIGPGSVAAARTGRGLNENLARECLELHTVTPASGYTQADVTSLARILTGWSIELRTGDLRTGELRTGELRTEPAGFRYRTGAHEPGAHVLLGQTMPHDEQGGIQALRFLANHPATHRSLATKLARHFTADDPPPDAIRTIEGVLRDTRGDLGAAAATLTRLDAAWLPATKLRTPMEFAIAAFRLLDPVAPAQLGNPKPNPIGVLAGLGQPLWNAPAPNGWSDRAEDWAAPEAMLRRIDWAHGFAGRIGTRDPAALAEATLGPLVRPATLLAMQRAGSRRDAFTLLLTSPEFQRR